MTIYQLRGTFSDDHPDHYSQQLYHTEAEAKQNTHQFALECLKKHNTTNPLQRVDILPRTLKEPS